MAKLNSQQTGYRCAHCGVVYQVDPGDCGRCGMPDFERLGDPEVAFTPQFADLLATSARICAAPGCGQAIPPGALSCAYCGEPVPDGSGPELEANLSSQTGDPQIIDLVAADGTRIPLTAGTEVVLGRNPDASPWSAQLQNYPGVSRQHTSLTMQHGVLRVRDLGSSNGTWIDGQQINGAADLPVIDGTIIGLGRGYQLTVRTQAL